ncbi:MAG TPA: hypothetical protein VE130_03175 [Nitrososphaeraceae archaeon]|nr:hypothetical protein [Nitrososphaeraceae archaeon]
MKQPMNNANRKMLYYGAAACTGIAGILHLIIVPNAIGFNINNAIFFLVAGIAQLFWVLPMIKRWGRIWYAIGIGGTIILIGMWTITRIPDNPITGRGGPISDMAVGTEVFQIAYVVITGIILAKERVSKPQIIREKR